jgi:hypothetical protein
MSTMALDKFELANALTACIPWGVTVAHIILHGQTWLSTLILVGWSMHLPCAMCYHLLLATDHRSHADTLLRMDQTTQLLAAVCNMLAQSAGSHVTAVLVAMCVLSAADVGLWDLATQLDTKDWARANMITTAVFISCIPMVFSDNITGFCVAVGSFTSGVMAVIFLEHALAYSILHFFLGGFAWGIVALG